MQGMGTGGFLSCLRPCVYAGAREGEGDAALFIFPLLTMPSLMYTTGERN